MKEPIRIIDISEFVDIAGFEGEYAINKNGDIYCYPKFRKTGWTHEKIMGKFKQHDGYINACLYKNGVSKFPKVHILVASTFIPNEFNKPCVNHKDGDKSNNHVDNLEWCTYSENHKHAFKIGLKVHNANMKNSTAMVRRKLTFKQAEEIRRLRIEENKSVAQLSKQFNVGAWIIKDILSNKTYTVEVFK
jgi:hypothetical protein